jgi:hypothetical protein
MVCSVIFPQKMVLVTWMPEPPYRMAGQSKKIAAERCVYIFGAPMYMQQFLENGTSSQLTQRFLDNRHRMFSIHTGHYYEPAVSIYHRRVYIQIRKNKQTDQTSPLTEEPEGSTQPEPQLATRCNSGALLCMSLLGLCCSPLRKKRIY